MTQRAIFLLVIAATCCIVTINAIIRADTSVGVKSKAPAWAGIAGIGTVDQGESGDDAGIQSTDGKGRAPKPKPKPPRRDRLGSRKSHSPRDTIPHYDPRALVPRPGRPNPADRPRIERGDGRGGDQQRAQRREPVVEDPSGRANVTRPGRPPPPEHVGGRPLRPGTEGKEPPGKGVPGKGKAGEEEGKGSEQKDSGQRGSGKGGSGKGRGSEPRGRGS